MTDAVPTVMPLDGRLGWSTLTSSLAAGPDGLRLAADPAGPLGLGWRDGSLGGLILPRGFALDHDGTMLLLASRSPWAIRRFDRERRGFVELPWIGGAGHDARRFWRPRNIAVAHETLYVADTGNRRVQVFDLPTVALRHVWTASSVTMSRTGPWQPVDVATHDSTAFILDGRGRRVFRHRADTDELELLIDGSEGSGRWRRLAVDLAGRIHVLEIGQDVAPRLLVHDPDGAFLRAVGDAGEVRGSFAVPVVELTYDRRDEKHPHFRFRGPDPCDSSLPGSDPSQPGLTFDRDGGPVEIDLAESLEETRYLTQGVWRSAPLDSRTFRCQWHRVELDLDRVPPGTVVTVHTATTDQSGQAPLFEDRPIFIATGQLQPPPVAASAFPEPASKAPDQPSDFLVQSWPGQYLHLKLTMTSDGFSTPILRGLRIRFPRDSYLGYLPAVYSGDDIGRSFLERFLGIFQTDWDDLEARIDTITKYFDADAVPVDNGFLDALAERFGLPLEGRWTGEQRRTLLRAMRVFYTHRGTAVGLRAYLQAYLQNMSDLAPADQGAYPVLVEGFRERPRLELAAPDVVPQGGALRLWSPDVVGRLTLGSTARVGAVRLMDTGDPAGDIFEAFAHRFRVYVPAMWVRSADDEDMLHRALEAEKPAHASYQLELVEPRFRIGVQSTVGMDTIIGDYPQAELTCARREDELPRAGRGTRHRLGYDTVLAGRHGTGPNQIQLH